MIHPSYTIRHMPFKRVFDLVFSSCVLLVGAPLFLLIALLIKATSPGPIFYTSIRGGRGGKLFKCWKYRSMSADAEETLKKLLAQEPALKKEWQKYAKLKNDPRVTKIGKILRKTSLDEIPQFWNVLKGDLSIVGPRPYSLEEIQTFSPSKAKKILSMRPGLTGIWQTSGRNLLTFQQRVSLEETYIEKQSFILDLILIFKTIPTMLFTKGAY